MPRSYRPYLEDIITSASKIMRYVGDSSLDDLLKDEMRLDAIIRNFEIIGEAANKMPDDIQRKYPSVEWRKIADFRNVLAHQYFGIDYEIMWEIIKQKLPLLREGIQSIIEHEN
jgi:uncharacterized protein with HEPN domain